MSRDRLVPLGQSELEQVGDGLHDLVARLYPICRSITGDGVRESLEILKEFVPLAIREVKTGTKVFDWTVPKEWNIRDAYVLGPNGDKIIDFTKSNIHVLGYSAPVRAKMPLEELRCHLFSLPDRSDKIPYLTSYYDENWGFCLSHRQLLELEEGLYEVCIDSELKEGHLSYGEVYLEGQTTDEFLISTYTCHPSLCNDNLSGVALAAFLGQYLDRYETKYSYRILFLPETIGSITWLCLNEQRVEKIKHGLVATCVGDKGISTYKRSRQATAEIDRAAEIVLRDSACGYVIEDFYPHGSDERQYCSPGFDLPVGSLTRTPPGRFDEYHTSGDDLDAVHRECLADSLAKYVSIACVLENNRTYLNLNPKCEPQLGKRGLYATVGGKRYDQRYSESDTESGLGSEPEQPNELAVLWLLNLCDGRHSLLDISIESGLEFGLLKSTSDVLLQHALLEEV